MKVFGIGLHKTGTTTLAECFRILGYNVCPEEDAYASAHDVTVNDYRHCLLLARMYEAFADSPWNFMGVYRVLDAVFPDAKFILTTRGEDQWFRSVLRWVALKNAGAGIMVGALGTEVTLKTSEEAIEGYRKHNNEVAEYFHEGTTAPEDARLLVVDFESGDGWERLCQFLGKPVPEAAFPHMLKYDAETAAYSNAGVRDTAGYSRKLQAYWDGVHTENDHIALTGASLAGHCEALCVDVVPGNKVLCVGVGEGGWVRDLAKVAVASALDISPVALEKVEDVAETYVAPSELPSNTFDCAMSMWVVPHVNDPDLQQLLTEVIRSLVLGGVFAVHYNEPLDEGGIVDNRCGCDDEPERIRLAAMLRRRSHFARMVECSGGEVLKIVHERAVESCQVRMVMAHVGQRGGGA